MKVVGDVGLADVQKAAGAAIAHLQGAGRFLLWLYVPGLIATMSLVAWLIDRVLPGAGVLGIVLVGIVGLYLFQIVCRNAIVRAWEKRGAPRRSHAAYQVGAEALVIQWYAMETRLAWKGVSQIAPGRGAWIFMGPGLGYVLPTRLFADQATERAFLQACLERMAPEAQARSVKARAVAAA
ncbi:MAG: YcxB family protein [Caulobacter sp.]